MAQRLYEVRPEDVSELGAEGLVELLALLLRADLGWFHVPYDVDVPDGGIDGLSRRTRVGSAPVGLRLPSGLTGWQVKAARRFSNHAALKDPFEENGTTPKAAVARLLADGGAYALVCGRQLTATQRSAWEIGIRKKLQAAAPAWTQAVYVLDANLLKQWVDAYPAVALWLRERVRRPIPSSGRSLRQIDRSGELTYAWTPDLERHRASLIDSMRVPRSVVRVRGPRVVGKTRFVLECLGESAALADVVMYIDASEDIGLRSHLRQLVGQSLRAVVVVDECDETLHRVLAAEVGGDICLVTIGHRLAQGGADIELTPVGSDAILTALTQRWERQPHLHEVAEDADGYIGVALELVERWDGVGPIPLLSERTFWRFMEPTRQPWAIDFQTLALFAELAAVFGPVPEEDGKNLPMGFDRLVERFELPPASWPRAHRELVQRDLMRAIRPGFRVSWSIVPKALQRILVTRFLEARSQAELATLLLDDAVGEAARQQLARWIVDAREVDRFERVAHEVFTRTDWSVADARPDRIRLLTTLAPSSPGVVTRLCELLLYDMSDGSDSLLLTSAVVVALAHADGDGLAALLRYGLRLAGGGRVIAGVHELEEAIAGREPEIVLRSLEVAANEPKSAEASVVAWSLLAYDAVRVAAWPDAPRSAKDVLATTWRLFRKWWVRPEMRQHLWHHAADGLMQLAASELGDDVMDWLRAERPKFGIWCKGIRACSRRREPKGVFAEVESLLLPRADSLDERAALWVRWGTHAIGWFGMPALATWTNHLAELAEDVVARPLEEVAEWVVANVGPEAIQAYPFGQQLAQRKSELGTPLLAAWRQEPAERRSVPLMLGFIRGARASGASMHELDAVIDRESDLAELRRQRELHLDQSIPRLEVELRRVCALGTQSAEYQQLLLLDWARQLSRENLDTTLRALADIGDVAVHVVLDLLGRAVALDERSDASAYAGQLLTADGTVESWLGTGPFDPTRIDLLERLVVEGHSALGMKTLSVIARHAREARDLHRSPEFRTLARTCWAHDERAVLDILWGHRQRGEDLVRWSVILADPMTGPLINRLAPDLLLSWIDDNLDRIEFVLGLAGDLVEGDLLAPAVLTILDRFGERQVVRASVEQRLVHLRGTADAIKLHSKRRQHALAVLQNHQLLEVRMWSPLAATKIAQHEASYDLDATRRRPRFTN